MFFTRALGACKWKRGVLGNATLEILFVFGLVAGLVSVFHRFFVQSTMADKRMISISHKEMQRLRDQEMKRW